MHEVHFFCRMLMPEAKSTKGMIDNDTRITRIMGNFGKC